MDNSKHSAWFKAAKDGDTETIRALKDQCSGQRTTDGETALMVSVRTNAIDVMELLVDNEATLVNDYGYTALLIAAEENNVFACSLLAAAEKDICLKDNADALILATEAGAMEALYVLAPGWPVRRTCDGVSALDLAVHAGSLDIINLLLQSQQFTDSDIEQALLQADDEDSNYNEVYSALRSHLLTLNRRPSTPGRDVPLELSDQANLSNSVEFCPSMPLDSLPLAYSALDNTAVAMTKIALEASDDAPEVSIMPGSITPISQQINADLMDVTPTEPRGEQRIDLIRDYSDSDVIEPDPTSFREKKRVSVEPISDTIFKLTNIIQERNPTADLMKIISCKDEEIQQLRGLVERLKTDSKHRFVGDLNDSDAYSKVPVEFPTEAPPALSATTNIALNTIDTLKARVNELEKQLAGSAVHLTSADAETQFSCTSPASRLIECAVMCSTECAEKEVSCHIADITVDTNSAKPEAGSVLELERIQSQNAQLSTKLRQTEQELSALSACLSTTLIVGTPLKPDGLDTDQNPLLQEFAQREREIVQAYIAKMEVLQHNLDAFIESHKKKAEDSELYFQRQLEKITEQNVMANDALQSLTAQADQYKGELKDLRDTIAYLNEENASLSEALKLVRSAYEGVSVSINAQGNSVHQEAMVKMDTSVQVAVESVSVQLSTIYEANPIAQDSAQETVFSKSHPSSAARPAELLAPVATAAPLPAQLSYCEKLRPLDTEMLGAIIDIAFDPAVTKTLETALVWQNSTDTRAGTITASNLLQAIARLQNEYDKKEESLLDIANHLTAITAAYGNLAAELEEKYNLHVELPVAGTTECVVQYCGPELLHKEVQVEINSPEDSLVLQAVFPTASAINQDVPVSASLKHPLQKGTGSTLDVDDLTVPDLEVAKPSIERIEISYDRNLSASPPVHLQVPIRSPDKATKKQSPRVRPVDNILVLPEEEDPSLMLPSVIAGELRATKLKQIGSEISPTTNQADRVDMQRAHDIQERTLHISHDSYDAPEFQAVFSKEVHAHAQRTLSAQNGEDSPLILAVLQGQNSEIKKHLQHAGKMNRDGVTALMIAALRNNLEAVKILVEYERGKVTADGSNALCLALLKGNLQVAKFLTPYEGLDFSYVSTKGKRFTELMQAADEDNILAVWCLIPHQGGLRDEEGFTALMYAVQAGNYELARILYELEGRVRNSNGETALMLAAASGFTRIVNMLMIREAGERDDQGRTALMRAAIYNHCDVIRLLLQKEGGIQDNRGETALMFAAKANNPDVVGLLLEKEGGKRMFTKHMGKGGAQVKGPGYTALIHAIRKNSLACVPLLLGREGHMKDAEGRMPIFFAKTKEMKDLLLEG